MTKKKTKTVTQTIMIKASRQIVQLSALILFPCSLGRHSSREENDQEDSGQHNRRPAHPTHPMRRPRTQGSTTMSAVQLPPEIAAMMIGGDDGGSDRGSRSGSGSRSRRSRQGGSGSGSSGRGSGGFRDYRVERHTHFPTNEDSN